MPDTKTSEMQRTDSKGRSDDQSSRGQSVARRDNQEFARAGDWLAPTFPQRFFGLSPFTLMRGFTDEMDRVFRGFAQEMEGQGWSPAVDVQQCNGKLVISAELPGLKREDVKVELTDDSLIIEGERRKEHTEDHDGVHRFERSYGHFFRSVPLPEGAKTDQVKAELKDGLLKVSVPVPEPQKQLRQVPIEDGGKGNSSNL